MMANSVANNSSPLPKVRVTNEGFCSLRIFRHNIHESALDLSRNLRLWKWVGKMERNWIITAIVPLSTSSHSGRC